MGRYLGYLVAVAALLVALVTGLNSLYIGKPFGTFWDYVLTVTWGIGTQTVLAGLTAALTALGGLEALRRIRL